MSLGSGQGSETTTPSAPPAEHSLQVLDQYLEGCLESVAQRAPVQRPAEMLKLIPSQVPVQHHPLLLTEMIKMDMAIDAESGSIRSIEDYIDGLSPPLSRESVSLDLVMEERQLLQSLGKRPPQPLEQRFPHLANLDLPLGSEVEATSAAVKTRAPQSMPAGTTVDDFSIIRELGKGAFAQVYLARQNSMQRLVALKVSRGTGAESQTLAQLDHPNIVRVYDQRMTVCPECNDDGEVHLLYMQYVPGGTLADVVKVVRDGSAAAPGETPTGQWLLRCIDQQLLQATQQVPERSSLRQWLSETRWAAVVAWIGIQLSAALRAAHERGVLHRDVKPANVLLTAEGVPKLADFNVSFAGAAGRAGAAANFGGSIAYMAPEHLHAVRTCDPDDQKRVGTAADFYSLAVMLWELWQGQRPFQVPRQASSWTEMLQQQCESRDQPLAEPVRCDDPSERVLESALRDALHRDPEIRIAAGARLEAHLKLALHPEVAGIFDPPPSSYRRRLMRWSPRWLAAAVILTPNIAAGVFNYFYNQQQIIQRYSSLEPSFQGAFEMLAFSVNTIAFPTGAALLVYFTKPVVMAARRVAKRQPVPENEVDASLRLGRQAAIIGGSLWIIAGAIYPTMLRWWFPSFDRTEAMHFFMSLLICGGVAAVYPYFGMLWLVTKVYYPRFQRDRLTDLKFEARGKRVATQGVVFLLAAAVIPLIGLMLLLSRDVIARGVMLVAVLASIAGLCAALFAYDRIISDWRKMARVLGNRRGVVGETGDTLI
ncbi:Serine/threonine-protein kinase PrkC [Crateriforma conspicua]|uniref:Serine/threonine-protein kinase PrkC n=1 Tax=Crateriforma conspicua TaxID=2527996 RepID=A0A5C6FTE2_9PLAN|nr:serine/threonine-protein kinase [Crateriforma conspicua]TWU66267.1 Serine/threonine-protein kinase PrkC [Crateriforma conspicua]